MYKLTMLLISMLAVIFIWFNYTSATVGFVYNPTTNAAEFLSLKNHKVNFIASNIDSDLEKFFRYLSSRGVKFVIGPSMSVDGKKVLPYLKKYDILALSPTISSTKLLKSGYIYSLTPSNKSIVVAFQKYLEKFGCSNLLLVLDDSNREYSDEFKDLLSYFPGDFVYYQELSSIKNVPVENYDTAVLTTVEKDSFEIIKFLRTKNTNIRIFATEASFSKEFLKLGGIFLQGVYFLVPKMYSTEGVELAMIDNWVGFIQNHRFLTTQQFRRFINTHIVKVDNSYVYFTEEGVKKDIILYVVQDGEFKEVQ